VHKLTAPPLPTWLASELPFERYLLTLSGHRVHVMETGDPSGPAVLLLHGNPTWGYLWRKVAQALAGAPLRLIMSAWACRTSRARPAFTRFRTTHAWWRACSTRSRCAK
jgi:pimeloyl-ACP methyl ester carboxylesterase